MRFLVISKRDLTSLATDTRTLEIAAAALENLTC